MAPANASRRTRFVIDDAIMERSTGYMWHLFPHSTASSTRKSLSPIGSAIKTRGFLEMEGSRSIRRGGASDDESRWKEEEGTGSGSGRDVQKASSGRGRGTERLGSNEALRYVSYPTQVPGKSCKMVPVFVAGILLANKAAEYALGDYLHLGGLRV